MNFTTAIQQYLTSNNLIRFTPRAALIDMDGTLYDSMPGHARAWQQMMAEIGVTIDYDEMFLHEGRTGAATIDLLMRRAFGRPATEEEMRDLYCRKTEIFAAMPPVSPMPGAAEMLNFFRMAEIKCVLVTGSGQSSLLNRLDTDFPGIFDREMRVTSRDVVNGKPHPEPFIKAMEKAGAKSYESIVVENAPLGVEAGHRSGAFTIGVTTGPVPAEALREAGADVVFGSMTDCAAELPLLVYGFITTMNNYN